MRAKTPLHVFVELLVGGDVDDDAETLRALARQYARTRRAREMAEYLIAAADERLPRERKAGGSLKHVLWSLRDVAGDLYEPAATEVLKHVLTHPKIPLTNVLPHIRGLGTVSLFYGHLAEGRDWRALAEHLQEYRVGPWRVAVNETPRNLTDVAMRLGYDVMVARSAKGAAVKARRGLRLDAARLPGSGWKQVYPDLAVWTRSAHDAPAVRDILAALEEVLE